MTMPGTRWVSIRGKHTGNEVEVVKLTGGDRVVVRRVGGEGASWSNAKSEAAGLQTLGREVFLANYEQKDRLLPGDTRGSRSFRRNGATVTGAIPEPTPVPVAPAVLRFELETITPDMARAWLDRGGPNRKLSDRRVDIMAAAIRRGDWRMTGEAIKLDKEQRVRDGQHRLEAICRAGIAVQCLVVRNVPDDAFSVMDTGKSRNAADILGMHGVVSRFETSGAARALLIIERFGRYYVGTRDPAAAPTPKEQLEYVLAHPEITDAVRLAAQLRIRGFVGGAGLWAAVITLLLRTDAAGADIFVNRLIEGDNLPRDSSLLKLRNMTMGTRWSSNMKDRETLAALIIKAWNLWRRGEGVGQLHWRSEGRSAEPFPVPE